MNEKEKEVAQIFADFVNNNYKDEMKDTYQIVGNFRPQDGKDEMNFMYDMGFITALNWIGDLLGVKLAMPTKEEREEINELFKED